MKYRVFLPLTISVFLAIIPFFWLKPGWIDIGGDSSRLYFYDPLNYLKSFPLWGVAPDGFGATNVSYYLIPFVSFLYVLKLILVSSYLLITLFNSMQLVVAFLSVYWIVKEFLKIESNREADIAAIFSGVIAGLFYTLSPGLIHTGWDKAMFTHDQFFLYPFIFLLVLKYIHTKRMIFLLLVLITSFIFAPNFKQPNPSFLAFFSLAAVYLFLYAKLVRKTAIGFKNVSLAISLFFLIHLFHLLPQVLAIFSDSSNVFYQAAFSEEGKFSRGLGYFSSQVEATKFINNITTLPQLPPQQSLIPKFTEPFWFIFPSIVILALIVIQKRNQTEKEQKKNFLLLTLFLLIAIFAITAKVSDIGLSFYKALFTIPGFSMFRNYVGQFAYVFIFFYALTFGHALFYILALVNNRYKTIFFLLLFILITVTSSQFIRGDMINLVINPGAKTPIQVPIKMDPEYEKMLDYIRKNPNDGKYLTLPFTEAGLQMLGGVEGGAYQGPSTIPYLTGKQDFSGYQVMQPFSELFLRLMRRQEYEKINNLLGMLSIKYVFYNSDPYIYGENFPGLPYQNVQLYTPLTQVLYKDFIEQLAVKKKIDFGENYHIYELDDHYFLPHIYSAEKVYFFNGNVDNLDSVLSFDEENKRKVTLPLEGKDKVSWSGEMIVLASSKGSFARTIEEVNPPVITTSVTKELYTLLHPFLVLPDKFALTRQRQKGFEEFITEKVSPKTPIVERTIKENEWKDIKANKIFAERNFLFGAGREQYTLKVGEEVFHTAADQKQKYWVEYSEDLKENEGHITLLPNWDEKSSLDNYIVDALENPLNNKITFRIKDTMLNYTVSIIKNITDWQPNAEYIISFDYLINGNRPQLGNWKTYLMVISSLEKGDEAFLQIVAGDQTAIQDFATSSDIEIKNLSIIKIPYPLLLFQGDEKSGDQKKLPSITFTEMNPTRYKIEILGANNPYTLVFSDNFDKNWKLFLVNNSNSQDKNTFFNASFFQTWDKTPVAEDTHVQVNGYANAWLVKPEDTHGKTEYTLILELTIQRFFYIAFVVSLIAVGFCTVALIVLLYPLSKRYGKAKKETFS